MRYTLKLQSTFFWMRCGLITLAMVSAFSCFGQNKPLTDEYLQGYVESLFVFGYGLPSNAVSVKDGIIYIDEDKISGGAPGALLLEKIKQAVGKIKYAKSVVLHRKESDETVELADGEIDGIVPKHSLFHPLIADPKWPRFSLAYHYYRDDRFTKHAFAPNFGASFPFYRSSAIPGWEVGVQAGLFAAMDVGREPTALIDADYYISLPTSFRSNGWSGMVRVYHESTHLGDEFMLMPEGKKIERINLSFEGIDVFLSYDFSTLIRVYGGGGYIVHQDPSDVKPLKVQSGIEYRCSWTFLNGRLRPVSGIDIKSEQMAEWTPGISYKLGVQLENSALISNEIQLMFEGYSGKSMYGQFYKDALNYVGIGLHAFL